MQLQVDAAIRLPQLKGLPVWAALRGDGSVPQASATPALPA